MEKRSLGVMIEKYIIETLDEYVNECIDLGVSRSEVINAILKMYLDSEIDSKKNLKKLDIPLLYQGNKTLVDQIFNTICFR